MSPAAEALRRGQIVRVYEDPVTREREEGLAELLRSVGPADPVYDSIERWKVRFMEGDEVYRYVDPRDVVTGGGT